MSKEEADLFVAREGNMPTGKNNMKARVRRLELGYLGLET